MIFDKRSVVEKYEDQFKIKEMRNKHIFYDLYARVDDPEEARGFITELLRDTDWKTSVNKLMKFEEMEIEGIFRGGKLKPFKNIIKAYKEFKKGCKYPLLWKLFFFLGIGFLGFYIYLMAFGLQGWNPELILGITPIWFFLALLIYSMKESVSMALWVKASGVYDVKDEKADLRIIIAGDAEKKDKEAFDRLGDDVTEIYNVINRKYVSSVKRKITQKQIIKELKPKKKDPETHLFKSLKNMEKQTAKLEERFINGEIDKETYKDLKKSLGKRKSKVETMLDLVSM